MGFPAYSVSLELKELDVANGLQAARKYSVQPTVDHVILRSISWMDNIIPLSSSQIQPPMT